jgi:2-iminobutanoate/2-iminopropanoate deaminase
MTILRHEPSPLLHRVVVANNAAYLSGIVAVDGHADIAVQTDQVLDRLEGCLAGVGARIEQVVSATIFLTDMKDKAAMNEVWKRRFPAAALPARATIGVSDLDGPYRIEVTAIAALG